MAVAGILVVVTALLAVVLSIRRGVEQAFVEIAWVPGLALLLMYFTRSYLEGTLGYGVLALLLLIMALSVALSTLGLTLIARGGDGRHSKSLLW